MCCRRQWGEKVLKMFTAEKTTSIFLMKSRVAEDNEVCRAEKILRYFMSSVWYSYSCKSLCWRNLGTSEEQQITYRIRVFINDSCIRNRVLEFQTASVCQRYIIFCLWYRLPSRKNHGAFLYSFAEGLLTSLPIWFCTRNKADYNVVALTPYLIHLRMSSW